MFSFYLHPSKQKESYTSTVKGSNPKLDSDFGRKDLLPI